MSGLKLISDLRLLTSVMDDSYGFNDFNDLNGLLDVSGYAVTST
jgi:hypothetical protein